MTKTYSFGKTDPGRKRSNNEDIFVALSDIGISALADGMGGAAAGELASRIFADVVLEVFSKPPTSDEQMVMDHLHKSFELCNERIQEHVRQNRHHRGMGCTAELLAVYDRAFALGHVGDSRTYLYRRNQLRQLTHDHSLVQDMLDQGLITAPQARTHRLRNVILRALGTNETLPVDFIRGKVHPGDLFLLCSDGLTDMIDDGAILDVLSDSSIGIPEKASRLIDAANAAGGKDNITVVMTEVKE